MKSDDTVSVYVKRLLGLLLIATLVSLGIVVASAENRPVRPSAPVLPLDTTATNVILMIGDGMGPEQVKAAGYYRYGESGRFSFETAPYQAMMTTHSADSDVTDSAASATAMATGYKVNNGVVSVQRPGDGRELQTLLELFADRCKSTGLVATSYLTHATPAAFGAHEPSRDNLDEIGADYLTQTRPTVLLGGGGYGLTPAAGEDADYFVVSDRTSLTEMDSRTITRVLGLFGNGHMPYEYDYVRGATDFYDSQPRLTEMVSTTLDILEKDPDGFFLMVEGSRIDHAGHQNDIERTIFETLAFADAVDVVLDWARDRSDSLVIVTADHETGGLTVTANNGAETFPSVEWSTTGHTGVQVPVYAWGPNAEWITDVIDNTSIYAVVAANVEPNSVCDTYNIHLPLLVHAGDHAGTAYR